MGKRRGEGWGGRKRGGIGWSREGGKVTEGMVGKGQDMGWDREGRGGKGGRKDRGYSPHTSFPGAAADRILLSGAPCS